MSYFKDAAGPVSTTAWSRPGCGARSKAGVHRGLSGSGVIKAMAVRPRQPKRSPVAGGSQPSTSTSATPARSPGPTGPRPPGSLPRSSTRTAGSTRSWSASTRAFYGSQANHLAPLLREYGVQLWLPEVDGPVNLYSPTHQALLLMLGAQSKLAAPRARFRNTAAMQAQAREQGRHLGGRPPYGYRVADTGPRPNRADAASGRRLHRLEPDPQTAPLVKWIFIRRLGGHSIAGIRAIWPLASGARVRGPGSEWLSVGVQVATQVNPNGTRCPGVTSALEFGVCPGQHKPNPNRVRR